MIFQKKTKKTFVTVATVVTVAKPFEGGKMPRLEKLRKAKYPIS